jgi:hypothetical protein
VDLADAQPGLADVLRTGAARVAALVVAAAPLRHGDHVAAVGQRDRVAVGAGEREQGLAGLVEALLLEAQEGEHVEGRVGVDVVGEADQDVVEQRDRAGVLDLRRGPGGTSPGFLSGRASKSSSASVVGLLLAGEAVAVGGEQQLGEAKQDLRGPRRVVGVGRQEFFVAGDRVGAQLAGLVAALGHALAVAFN